MVRLCSPQVFRRLEKDWLFVNNHSTRFKPCAMIIILLQIYNFIFKYANILFKNFRFPFRKSKVLEMLEAKSLRGISNTSLSTCDKVY